MKHEAWKIAQIIKRFSSPDDIKNIWDIGARDGQDSLHYVKEFPNALIIDFEPNPDTYDKVKLIAENSSGRIKSYNYALSNVSGDLPFFKIDTVKTITSWLDGNPGASSMYPANHEYPLEKYITTQILVKSLRPSHFLKQFRVESPSLIHMDVQGAELSVLKGFDDHLRKVDFIYLEMSMFPLYQGQPLANEIVHFLKKNFYWHSNLTLGKYQFDAFFVNKRFNGDSLKFRDYFFRFSLWSHLYIGIEYPIPRLSNFSYPMSLLWNLLLEKFRGLDDSWFSKKASSSMLFMYQKLRVNMAKKVRLAISLSQPIDPLRNEDLPAIEVIIPCHRKDKQLLPNVIQSALSSVSNPISKIQVIIDSKSFGSLDLMDSRVDYVEQREFLSKAIKNQISLFPQSKQGWTLQQVVKLRACMETTEQAALVLDADTILLKSRVWLDKSGTQILCLANELQLGYRKHLKAFLQPDYPFFPVSFVTHHQLMKREYLLSIFDSNESAILDWLNAASQARNSQHLLSEYETYGQWVMKNFPNKVVLAKWNNASIPREEIMGKEYTILKANYSKFYSISCHTYL